ncbi:MAG: rRNA pseudouridine synthase [bacterium]|nr:MAG: rRNA pseudouridine synthase [bacterium]
MKVRLHKAIAETGLASRRTAEEMIRRGRVTVNGEVVTAMGVLVDPATDTIAVDGSPLEAVSRKRYYLLNKPPGYLCTRSDPQGRETVFDLLPDEVAVGLHTAGRLDLDAEGLLILTNDGELTECLTHPSGHLPKTYLVKVKGRVEPRTLKELRRGVHLEDGMTFPAGVSLMKGTGADRNSWLRMTLLEGRKNQIKRMGAAVGHRVLRIRRVSIGTLTLPGRIKPGAYRKLTASEVESLKRGEHGSGFKAQRPTGRKTTKVRGPGPEGSHGT